MHSGSRSSTSRAPTSSIQRSFSEIASRALAGERVGDDDALFLLQEATLADVCALGNALRRSRVPGNHVTFVIDTNPNTTNVCVTGCRFCAFHRPPGHPEAYRRSVAEVVAEVARAVGQGATTVLLQGGNDPEVSLAYASDLVRALRQAHPSLCLHCWSPPEVAFLAETAGLSVRDVLAELWRAGQRTLPGGGAEILVERVRRAVSPRKLSAEGWLEVMRTAHSLGYRTTATMMYGHVERDAEIIEHLRRLRELQDETGGFTAFIPWSYKPGNTRLAREIPQGSSPVRYLRIIACARIYLDNFDHVQASWFSEGKRSGQIALHAGADDFGGTLLEENVLRKANHDPRASSEECVALIREAGFVALQRTTLYEPVREW